MDFCCCCCRPPPAASRTYSLLPLLDYPRRDTRPPCTVGVASVLACPLAPGSSFRFIHFHFAFSRALYRTLLCFGLLRTLHFALPVLCSYGSPLALWRIPRPTVPSCTYNARHDVRTPHVYRPYVSSRHACLPCVLSGFPRSSPSLLLGSPWPDSESSLSTTRC